MLCIKQSAAIFFWVIVVIDCQQWYSATESDAPKMFYFGPPKGILLGPPQQVFRPNYVQDSDQNKFMPMTVVNRYPYENEWQVVKKHDINTGPSTNYKKIITNFDLLNTNKISYEQPVLITYKGLLPKKYTNTSAPNSIRIDKTINKINVVKRISPTRQIIRKRCPGIRQRQKKQLHLNQTARSRFLEVFEVVEYDHVVCTSSSGLEGVCLPEIECQTSEGKSMGTCADGYGTCCVTQFSCDDHSSAAMGWFTNPGFPSPSTERLSCAVTLNKASADVKQIRLDFFNFELLPPAAGTCEQDQFVVSGQNVNNIIPIFCGVNTGQHVYIEVGNVEGPITLSVQTVTSDSRLFAIKVTQLSSNDDLAAPAGCLQYFKGPQGFLESFNYRDKSDISIARSPSYLNHLNYAMCIERAPESCSITYTNTGYFQIVNYDSDGLPVIPPGQAGVEIFNCPTDWLLIAAVRLCGDRLNDGSVLQDFALDAPVTDVAAGPIVVWFRSDGGYAGRGFKIQYHQNEC